LQKIFKGRVVKISADTQKSVPVFPAFGSSGLGGMERPRDTHLPVDVVLPLLRNGFVDHFFQDTGPATAYTSMYRRPRPRRRERVNVERTTLKLKGLGFRINVRPDIIAGSGGKGPAEMPGAG
jgi:hypothetical protein